MNKMNLPAPFGQVTPTPPLVRFVMCNMNVQAVVSYGLLVIIKKWNGTQTALNDQLSNVTTSPKVKQYLIETSHKQPVY